MADSSASKHLARLLRRRLLLVTGKGGVGKSTLSLALVRLAERQGKRVLLAAMRTPRPFGGLISKLGEDGELTEIGERSCAVHITPRATLREYVLKVVRWRLLYRLVFENRMVRHFLRAIPALPEIMALGKLQYHLRETLSKKDERSRFDLIVLDCPATGHGVSLLRLPRMVVEASSPGPLQSIARDIRELLTDPKLTGVVLVSTPEEMPVNEALEIEEIAVKEGVFVGLNVVNGYFPHLFQDSSLVGEFAKLQKQRLDLARPPEIRPIGVKRAAFPRRQELRDAMEADPASGETPASDGFLAELLRATAVYLCRHVEQRVQVERLKSLSRSPVVVLPYSFDAELGTGHVDESVRILEWILGGGRDASSPDFRVCRMALHEGPFDNRP